MITNSISWYSGVYGSIFDRVKDLHYDPSNPTGNTEFAKGYSRIPADAISDQDSGTYYEQVLTPIPVHGEQPIVGRRENYSNNHFESNKEKKFLVYDFSDLILSDSSKASFLSGDFKKVAEYWSIINHTLFEAELLMAEHSSVGNDVNYMLDPSDLSGTAARS